MTEDEAGRELELWPNQNLATNQTRSSARNRAAAALALDKQIETIRSVSGPTGNGAKAAATTTTTMRPTREGGGGGDKRRKGPVAAKASETTSTTTTTSTGQHMIERLEDDDGRWPQWQSTAQAVADAKMGPLEQAPELTDGLRRDIDDGGVQEHDRNGAAASRARRPQPHPMGPGGGNGAGVGLGRKPPPAPIGDINRSRDGKQQQNKNQTSSRTSGQREAWASKGDELERAGLPRDLEEAVRAQLAEQLSPSSPLGRELTKQLSAYFGGPVEIRAVRPGGKGPGGSNQAAPTSRRPHEQGWRV